MALTTFKAVTHKGTEGLVAISESRGFKVIMDEPESLGGTNKGFNPVEMLLVALGGCVVIVASVFAKDKEIDLQDIWVETEGDLDPAGFMHGKEGVRPGFQTVRATIHIKSNSPEDKLLEFQKFVESRCPVSDTLMGTKVVAEKLVIER